VGDARGVEGVRMLQGNVYPGTHFEYFGECLEINSAANVMGCMQRIRRFLSNKRISPTITVLPLIRLMRPLLSNLPEIVLVMDRTVLGKSAKSYINILTGSLQARNWLNGSKAPTV